MSEETHTASSSTTTANDSHFTVKPKNWPAWKPILRHSIKEDIPEDFKKIVRFYFFDRFYVVFFLIVNVFAALICYLNKFSYETSSSYLINLFLSPLWLVIWGIMAYVFYWALYTSLSENHSSHYAVFIIGSILEIILSIIAIAGFFGFGFMGISCGFMVSGTISIIMCYLVAFAFFVNLIFLIISLVKIQMTRTKSKKYFNLENDSAVNGADIELKDDDDEAAAAKNLPEEVNGRKIKYLKVDDDVTNDNSEVKRLTDLPNGSLTVISEWKKVEDGKFILYVENEPERAYWSNEKAAGIIGGGLVDPETQVLTVSRLPDGSFVFGVADKNQQ